MRSLSYVFRETARLVWAHKFYFLLPVVLAILLLTFLAYRVGPSVSISFIYSGL